MLKWRLLAPRRHVGWLYAICMVLCQGREGDTQFPQNKIVSVAVGDVSLERKDGQFTVAGLAEHEQVPEDRVNRVFAGAVLVHHRACCEGVAKIVDTRTTPMDVELLRRSQSDALANGRKVVASAAIVGAPAGIGDKERARRVAQKSRATIRMTSRIASGRNVPERLFVASS
jgi:hypothetical protein